MTHPAALLLIPGKLVWDPELVGERAREIRGMEKSVNGEGEGERGSGDPTARAVKLELTLSLL